MTWRVRCAISWDLYASGHVIELQLPHVEVIFPLLCMQDHVYEEKIILGTDV